MMNYFIIYIRWRWMMLTSYYQKSGSLPNAVAISPGCAEMVQGELYKKLAPHWEIMKIDNEATFWRLYHEMVLSHLNTVHVADDLEGKVLLCWELPGQFCHRLLVAEWLEKNLLIEVPELDVPKAAAPRSIQRELWSFLYRRRRSRGGVERSAASKLSCSAR
jgi:hypothetical protein